MRFIHAADCHLDSPFLGLKGRQPQLFERMHQATFKVFKTMIDVALNQQVDFVLLAGDVFDSDEQSITAQAFLIEQFQRLSDANIPVVLSYGNHDYQRDETLSQLYPANVKVMPSDVSTLTLRTAENETVAISGFSYDTRWQAADRMQAFPMRAQVDWHIGMYHGSVAGSTSIEGNYAPFTMADLKRPGYDYWALGHIHQQQTVLQQPLSMYSGCLQGRSRNEQGDKGFLLVHSEQGRLVPEFEVTSEIVWDQFDFDIAPDEPLRAVGNRLIEQLQRPPVRPQLVILKFNHSDRLHHDEQVQINSDRWLQGVQARLNTGNELNNFPIDVQIERPSKPVQLDSTYFDETAAQVFSEDQIEAVLATITDQYGTVAFDPATLKQHIQQTINELVGGDMDAD